jgi:hypothetical protein
LQDGQHLNNRGKNLKTIQSIAGNKTGGSMAMPPLLGDPVHDHTRSCRMSAESMQGPVKLTMAGNDGI